MLEDNGWESQQIMNAIATMVLQEAMGFQVVLLQHSSARESAQRIGAMNSHAGKVAEMPGTPWVSIVAVDALYSHNLQSTSVNVHQTLILRVDVISIG